MKRGLMVMVCLVFLVSFVSATNHYVSPSGSASWSLCTNINTPCSLSTANSNAVADDVVYLRGDSYTGSALQPAHSGSSGHPITYKNYPEETAIFSGMNNGINLANRSYITIDGTDSNFGIRIQNTHNTWIALSSSSHIIIQHCYMRNNRGWAGISATGSNSYIQVLNNNMANDGKNDFNDIVYFRDSANYNVFEGNYFGDAGHTALNIHGYATAPIFNVVRNNVFENTKHGGLGIWPSGSDPYYVLFEGNIIKNGGTDKLNAAPPSNTSQSHAVQVGATYIIGRKNILYGNKPAPDDNSGYMVIALTFATYDDGKPKNWYSSYYHNTFYDNEYPIFVRDNLLQMKDNVIKNNIIYKNEHDIYSWPRLIPGVEYINNSGNSIDPHFVNIGGGDDFTLQSDSAMIDAGGWLTFITSATGSGKTSFTVDRSLYFYDGWGIPGETGDVIKTQNGQTTTIQSINYDTNMITVSPAINIVNGEGLSLDYSGSAPDIGAFEYASTPTYSCTGTIPSNAAAWDSEESENLGADTPWTYSSSDTSIKCQYHCNSGYTWSGSSCVLQQQTYSYTILKTNLPPTIDGILNEFANANSLTITNSNGNSATYKMLWDSNSLYIAAQGTDDQLAAIVNIKDQTGIWDDDSIELFFDTLNNGGKSSNSDDYKFFVNLLNTSYDFYNGGGGVSWNTALSSKTTTSGTLNVAGNVDAGYTIEVAIPWKDWVAPSDNSVWGFDVNMNDRRDNGTRIWEAWSETSGLNIPNEFGDVTFSSQFVSSGSVCKSLADSNSDGVISISELINYISQWKTGSVTIENLIDAIEKWKSGC